MAALWVRQHLAGKYLNKRYRRKQINLYANYLINSQNQFSAASVTRFIALN